MTPAVQYVRASTGLQACSLEQQAHANAHYAALRGFEIVDTYSDAAISGLTLKARPALQRLLTDALSPGRQFQAILVHDVSRWGRFQDIDEGAHYEFLCRRAGVAVHYCAEPFENSGSPEANLIKQIKRAMAAEFSRALSDRLGMAKRHLAAEGYAVTSPPFGLLRQVVDRRNTPGAILRRGETRAAAGLRVRFIPGPPEAVAAIRRLFHLYAITGLKPWSVAEQLNAEGAASPMNRGWNAQRVRACLRQPAYAGTYVYGRSRTRLGGPTIPLPPDKWRRTANAIPPIVRRTLYDRAQALVNRGRRERTDAEMLDDLRDLLATHGRLDTALIDATDGMAQAVTYGRRFGSLGEAFRRVGYVGRKPRK